MNAPAVLTPLLLSGLAHLNAGGALTPHAPSPPASKTDRAPIKGDTRWKNIGPRDGQWCRVEASLNWGRKPTLVGTIQTEAHSTKGFHGGGYVDLLDKQGNILVRVVAPSVGQNTQSFPFFASPRTLHYSIPFDPADADHAVILAKVASVRVTACYGDEPDFLKKLKDTAKDAYKVYEAVQGK